MRRLKKTAGFPGRFVALPHAVLCSQRYRALSPSAIKLLIDIAMQYNGKNNGDLSAAWKIMSGKGWRSEATLNRAKKEVLAAGLVAETRKGRLPNTCSLYGLTWYPLDPNPKLDYGPAGFPAGLWAEPLALTRTPAAGAVPATVPVARPSDTASVLEDEM